MGTSIRLQDETKEELDEILDEEGHSSMDSVVKSLLKEREIAQLLRDKGAYDKDAVQADMAVLNDVDVLEDGLMFFYCPNCGSELSHPRVNTVSNPFHGFDTTCHVCGVELTEHSIINISRSYPSERLEEKDEEVLEEMRMEVIQYWNRMLQQDWSHYDDEYSKYSEDLADKFRRVYARMDDWNWPDKIPVIELEKGRRYAVNTELWTVIAKQDGSMGPKYTIRKQERDMMGGSESNEQEVVEEELGWFDIREKIVNRGIRLYE